MVALAGRPSSAALLMRGRSGSPFRATGSAACPIAAGLHAPLSQRSFIRRHRGVPTHRSRGVHPRRSRGAVISWPKGPGGVTQARPAGEAPGWPLPEDHPHLPAEPRGLERGVVHARRAGRSARTLLRREAEEPVSAGTAG